MAAYSFGILKTDGSQEAVAHNAYWLGRNTLGVEVTQESLAARCGLGNDDPQHGEASRSSAIELALDWPLPSDGSRIVTIRPDKDSIGAMAVFMLRVADVEFDDLLVHWVGALDREPSEAATKHPELCNMFRREITDALDVIAHNNVNWPTLSEKVLTTAQVLANDMPQPDVDAIARLKERYAGDFEVEMSGDNVAFIHAPSLYVEARNWGNRRFPVTVVFDPTRVTDSGGLQQKWTIVRKPGVFDRLGFEKSINVAEAQARGLDTKEVHERNFAWGGNRNIVSSPQGAGYGTKLSKETILAIVREHAESGIVS